MSTSSDGSPMIDEGQRGFYGDGLTAAQTPVAVTLDDAGLRLDFGDGRTQTWPYHALTSLHPVRPGDHLWLGIERPPGEGETALAVARTRLFLPAFPATVELLRRAPQLTVHRRRWQVLRPMLAVTAIAGLVAAVAYFSNVSQMLARALPDAVRQELGDRVVASMAPSDKVCTDPKGRAALDKLLARLAADGRAGRPAFSVQIAKLRMINAFAAPGERIVVTHELLQFVDSADALAGVIAHEMGHGIERHPEAGIIRAMGTSLALDWVLGNNSGTLSQLGGLLLSLKYSRDAEREADTVALDLLKEAGIGRHGFASFFTKIEAKYGLPDDSPELLRGALDVLSTHPASPERVAAIEGAADWPTRPLLDDAEWDALKAICKGVE